jgi:hypothetical protein
LEFLLLFARHDIQVRDAVFQDFDHFTELARVVLSGDEKFIRSCLWWCGRGRNFEISSLESGGFWLRLGRHSSVMTLQKLPVKKVETVVIDNNPCRCQAHAPLSRLAPPRILPRSSQFPHFFLFLSGARHKWAGRARHCRYQKVSYWSV